MVDAWWMVLVCMALRLIVLILQTAMCWAPPFPAVRGRAQAGIFQPNTVCHVFISRVGSGQFHP